MLGVVAAVRASECGQAAVDLWEAVHLTLAAVPAPQARVTNGQSQSVTAGWAVVQREGIQTLAQPEEEVTKS